MKKILLALCILSFTTHAQTADESLVDQLSIRVTGQVAQSAMAPMALRRLFAYSNKQAGTYYGEVNAQNSSGWRGWYINTQNLLRDYEIQIDSKPLDRTQATTIVFPHELVRTYPNGIEETFALLDSINAFVVSVQLPASLNETAALSLLYAADTTSTFSENEFSFASLKVQNSTIPSWIAESSQQKKTTITFAVAASSSKNEAKELCSFVMNNSGSLIASRKARMESLLHRSFTQTENSDFNKALAWAKLSLDALIMNQAQSGVPTKGIFAGLPWFDNYWGRDTFISLPGATYVTGNFSDAKNILLSFARFQEKDSTNTNYGRIPNIVNPTSLAYNTADGTPRFVIELANYVRYSGDTTLFRSLWPVVKRSIKGTLKYHTDSLFFLTHGDAETWMDAVGPNGPWSPRGNRACDIQALWLEQLLTGATIAQFLGHDEDATQWKKIAATLEKNFDKYFINEKTSLVYDHLKADGTPSAEMRPNQLFCFDMLKSEDSRRRMIDSVTQNLIYPYGVSTLAQTDSNFHPFHHYEPIYVQDAAYHNGIVWTWLNGQAIHALARNDLQEIVYPVTQNMVHQILDRGCVGTLSELLDAYPRDGENEPRLSGAFSQAWSLGEFIRSTYQDYFGVNVDALDKRIRINPKLPKELGNIAFTFYAGAARIGAQYEINGDTVHVTLQSDSTLTPQRNLREEYAINYLWEYDNGDAVLSDAILSPRSTLEIIHTRGKLLIKENGELVSEDTFGADSENTNPAWYLKGFSEKNNFAGIHPQGSLRLASPISGLDIPALHGPSYAMLNLDQVKHDNPRAIILFDAADSVGDDKGISGTYIYPTNANFKPGIFDLTHATIRYDSAYAYFTLQFRNLSNPGWHPEYGFQLTLAAIAIDFGDDNGAMEVGNNSHYVLDQHHAFQRLITVGGGVRVTDAHQKILCQYLPQPTDVANPLGDTKQKSVEFSIPLKYLVENPLESENPGRWKTPSPQWKITILIGGQDDHGGAGVGEFRSVEEHAGEWNGGGKKNSSDSNIYDIVVLEKR
jgi:glycogen debranching enzyme